MELLSRAADNIAERLRSKLKVVPTPMDIDEPLAGELDDDEESDTKSIDSGIMVANAPLLSSRIHTEFRDHQMDIDNDFDLSSQQSSDCDPGETDENAVLSDLDDDAEINEITASVSSKSVKTDSIVHQVNHSTDIIIEDDDNFL